MEKFKPLIRNIVKPLTYKLRPIKFKIKPETAEITVTYMKDGKETAVSARAEVYLKEVENLLND